LPSWLKHIYKFFGFLQEAFLGRLITAILSIKKYQNRTFAYENQINKSFGVSNT